MPRPLFLLSCVSVSDRAPAAAALRSAEFTGFSDRSQLSRDSKIFTAQRERLEALGEQVQWVTDTSEKQRPAIMLKSNGTLFFLDTTRGD